MYSLGCDIGGTFTDFVILNQVTGEITIHKTLTTPLDPSEAVKTGALKLTEAIPNFFENVKEVIHGTTLIINAILERKGARTALITTKGFRDILEFRTGLKYDLYDLQIDFPSPLIPRYLRREIDERIYSNGEVLEEAKNEDIHRLLLELIDEGVESIAVSLLHSYKNPIHEELVKKTALKICPHIPVSISSEVLPEIREYERTSATVINAYVRPLIASYLGKLDEMLESLGFHQQLFLLLSNGGIVPSRAVENFPVRIIESGPAGGVMLSQYLGKIAREENDLLSFDMGGTTAKSCLIKDGRIPKSEDYEVARTGRFKKGSGIPVKIPVIDLLEIGAGGGSVAQINEMGLLQVGPQSSGANPGPACYGQGGKNPCVMDADLVLGYLNPAYFLGGAMSLDLEIAQKVIMENVAKPLKISITKAAWGIHNIVNDNMALAAKMYIIERGGDPLRTTLVAYGGAGPLHAYGLAKILRIPKILIPQGAGVASAIGFFVSPFNYELVHTHRVLLEQANLSEIEKVFQEMEREAASFLPKIDNQGLINYARSIDMHYVGQGSEINIPFNYSILQDKKEDISRNFDSIYKRFYGRISPDKKEIMNLRVIASLPDRAFSLKKFIKKKNISNKAAIKGHRKAYSSCTSSYENFAVYDRYQLFSGTTFNGPAIIEEKESTTILEQDASASIDEYGTILISFKRR